jgi:hypothetical protein
LIKSEKELWTAGEKRTLQKILVRYANDMNFERFKTAIILFTFPSVAAQFARKKTILMQSMEPGR